MTTKDYLQKVLESQNLGDNSSELKALVATREHVEGVLRDAFSESSPTIRYGGSKAKGTLVKESYDLDIVCYFESGDTKAGDSLEGIYNNVAKALEKDYSVQPKTSALRLQSREHIDFHVDVVPGRFTDDSKTDCFLYQQSAEKCRLKTNLQVHIDHVRGSKLLDAIRLLKLWKARRALPVKQFVFELLTIDVLKDSKGKALEDQLIEVWKYLRDTENAPKVEDPANPSGNDLSALLDTTAWSYLRTAATSTLSTIDQSGWETVFGAVVEEATKAQFRQAAAAVSTPTRPWCK